MIVVNIFFPTVPKNLRLVFVYEIGIGSGVMTSGHGSCIFLLLILEHDLTDLNLTGKSRAAKAG